MQKHFKRHCGVHKHQATAKRLGQLFTHVTSTNKIIDDGKPMYIDVVVHICYQDKETPDCLNDIHTMITTLNEDFNGKCKNFDTNASRYNGKIPHPSVYKKMLSLNGSAGITFKLKNVLYKKLVTPLPNDDDLDSKNILIKVNHSPAVNPDSCLNLWIVDGLGGGLLGYATFPWDSLDPDKLKYDGVVIEKAAFGANPVSNEYNLNKTAVHEIGHWTGLYHTFQQGTIHTLDSRSIFDYEGRKIGIDTQKGTGDCIEDTPQQDVPTYGNLLKDHAPWPYTIVGINKTKSWHMFMNFMDYTDDDCMFMFTADQVKKMRLMLKMFRPKTVGHTGENIAVSHTTIRSVDNDNNNDNNDNDNKDDTNKSDREDEDSVDQSKSGMMHRLWRILCCKRHCDM